MYTYGFRETVEKELRKLAKRDPALVKMVGKKIEEIVCCENADHYKNLRAPMQHLKRVHIDNRRFVLVFSVDEQRKEITFESLKHHDQAYK